MTGESRSAAGAHAVLREQVGAYALGQLSGEQWRAVHAHLEVCATCRADLDEIAPVAGLLGATRSALDPARLTVTATDQPDPPPLAPELVAQVRAAGRGQQGIGGAGRSGPARWLPAAAAAVAIALAAGGLGYVAGGADGVPREAVAVRVLDPAVRAQADLVPHTWGMEVQLVASGFTAGETYAVTVTDDEGRTVSAGEFIGVGDAEMVCNLNSSVLRADAAGFEVAGPDGDVVLTAAV